MGNGSRCEWGGAGVNGRKWPLEKETLFRIAKMVWLGGMQQLAFDSEIQE